MTCIQARVKPPKSIRLRKDLTVSTATPDTNPADLSQPIRYQLRGKIIDVPSLVTVGSLIFERRKE